MDKIILNIEKMGLLEAQSDGKVVHIRTPSGVCVLDVKSAEELANNILNSIPDYPFNEEGVRTFILYGSKNVLPEPAKGFAWKWAEADDEGVEYELVKY